MQQVKDVFPVKYATRKVQRNRMISLPEDVARKLGLFDGSEAVVVIDSFDFCIVTEVRKINEAIETLKRWRDARLDDAIWTIEEYKAEFPKIYEEMCREGLVE